VAGEVKAITASQNALVAKFKANSVTFTPSPVKVPGCSIAGKQVTDGSSARCLAQYTEDGSEQGQLVGQSRFRRAGGDVAAQAGNAVQVHGRQRRHLAFGVTREGRRQRDLVDPLAILAVGGALRNPDSLLKLGRGARPSTAATSRVE
jgi:hypothetical protein